MNEIVITQENVNRAVYLLVVIAGFIAMAGGIVIYLDTKTKKEMKRKRKKR